MRAMRWAVLCVLSAAALAAADNPKPADKGKTDPPDVPIQATLSSNKATYGWDKSYGGNLIGKTPDDIRKMIDAGDLPPPPNVDLTLELKNTGSRDLQIRMGGTTNVIDLDLQGPDALSVQLKGPMPLFLIAPKTITLEAGKSQSIPISNLSFGFRGSHRAYWLAPGDYTLTASYKTTVSPAPQGSQAADEGFGGVTITSAPLTISVK